MKYKTFRALALSGCGVVGLALCGGGYAVLDRASRPKPTPTPFVDVEKNLFDTLGTPTSIAAATPESTPASVAGVEPLRAMDREILAAIPMTNILAADGKVKDGIRGKTYKVNFYAEGDRPGAVARLKIDLDRDDKWDEKWSKEGDGWKRQVSQNENETYETEFILTTGGWKRGGGSAVSAPTPATVVTQAIAAASGNLRPLDQRILDKARQPISGGKIKDAFKTDAWKVNIYQDAGHSKPNRLKIDFDRDEKWDEKWTFDADEVKRHVSPKDDDVYTEEYRLRSGAWVKK